ncbi:hypothetical protein L4C54_06440 [Vibrio lamellibrachiae]|uniref:DUF6162 family protein n=1 Tax=Vibrio lamellibrachiae TaxID=2910253 RepID=UPI003D147989
MIIQTVRADTGGREGKWVGVIILGILLFASVSIPFHQVESSAQPILDHQVHISDIDQENLAMIAELRLAHEEIRDVYFESNLSISSIAVSNIAVSNTDIDASALDSSETNQEILHKVWPSIEQMESDWIAPFVKDQSWKRKGEHEWQGLGEGLYLGIPSNLEAASLVLLDSTQASPQIWLSKPDKANLKDALVMADYQHEHLIKRGWKQVIMNSVFMSQDQDKHQH